MSISGLQTWLALPDDKEEVAPLFENTASAALPDFQAEGVTGRIIIGAFDGIELPGRDRNRYALRRHPARCGRER